MTEEVINGVNVAECSFYDNGKCNNPNGMACNCCNNAICYFKELKKLETENAMLKRHKRELGNVAQHFVKDIDRLQEKLKKIKEPYSPRLNCYTCSDTDRCNEQKEKVRYPIFEIISDIRRMVTGTEVSNSINKALDRLLSLIPSNTRCDVVLEKRLLQAEQLEQEANETVAELKAEYEKLKNKYNEEITVNTQLRKWQDEDLRQIAQLEKESDLFRKLHNNVQAQRRILEQKLDKIKGIATKYSQREDYLLGGLYADLIDKLNEVLKDE